MGEAITRLTPAWTVTIAYAHMYTCKHACSHSYIYVHTCTYAVWLHTQRIYVYSTSVRRGGEGATRVRKHACTRDAFDSNIFESEEMRT